MRVSILHLNCVGSTDGRKGTQGKGIADQDRNILSNQVLILGFLRSAARFLVRGPVPQLQPSRKRKRPLNEDEDDQGYTDEDYDHVASTDGRARGTILITLRNVPPYTAWCVTRHVYLQWKCADFYFTQGRAEARKESPSPSLVY
jgi:Domain of unknown function (DUF2431)